MKKRQNFIESASILLAATVMSKIFGAAFKIPLATLLGGEGMGYYMTAYSIFGPVSAVALSGMTIAMSKTVAEHENDPALCRGLMKKTFLLYTAVGMGVSLIIYAFAEEITLKCDNAYAVMAVKCIAPAFLFCSMSAAVRGYFEGMRNMYPTGISQVIESFFRLTLGSLLAYMGAKYAMTNYEKLSAFLHIENIPASSGMLMFTASMAVLGVTLSALVGTITAVIYYIGDLHKNKAVKSRRGGIPLKTVLLAAIPICLSSLAANISSVIDLSTIVKRINFGVNTDSGYFLEHFSYLFGSGFDISKLGVYLFGSYSGMAITVFNIMPTVATAFSVSAVPIIASDYKKESLNKTALKAENIIKYCTVTALPLGIAMYCLSHMVLKCIFPAKIIEINAISETMSILGIASVAVALSITVNAVEQAMGRGYFVLKTMIFTAILKYILNYILIGIPEINIKGAGISTLISYSFSVIYALWDLYKQTKREINFGRCIIKPVICSLSFFIPCNLLKGIMPANMNVYLGTVGISVFSGTIYLLILLIFKIIDVKELNLQKIINK